MSNIVSPVKPYRVEKNQYGFPSKTYYYIVDANNAIFHHKDNKWRKKETIQMTNWYYLSANYAHSAMYQLSCYK